MEQGKLVPMSPAATASPPAAPGGAPLTRLATTTSAYSSGSGGSSGVPPQITYVAKIADFGLAKLGFEGAWGVGRWCVVAVGVGALPPGERMSTTTLPPLLHTTPPFVSDTTPHATRTRLLADSGPVGGGGSLGGKLKSAVGTALYQAPELVAIEWRRDVGGGSTPEAREQLLRRREQLLTRYHISHPAVLSGAASPEAAAARMAALFTPAAVDECLRRAEHGYDAACDCWSLGVIAYVLLSGRMPFFPEPDKRAPARPMPLLLQHLSRFADFDAADHWGGVSEQAKDFIRRLLDPSPKTRLTAAEALKHPWLARRSGGGGDGGGSSGGGGGGAGAGSSSSSSSAAGASPGGDGPATKRARKE
jgi:serine/threonine protein kinase